MSQNEERSDPIEGVTLFKNPFTGNAALYFLYELKPNRRYRFDLTRDGETFTEVKVVDTRGKTHELYESWNVPDPANALWPRVIDLGPSEPP